MFNQEKAFGGSIEIYIECRSGSIENQGTAPVAAYGFALKSWVMSVWSCTQNAHAILKAQEFYDILMIKASHIFFYCFWLLIACPFEGGGGIWSSECVLRVGLCIYTPTYTITFKMAYLCFLTLIFYLNHWYNPFLTQVNLIIIFFFV